METQMLTPIPGQDYPRTWNEFLDWFATEEACQAFLEKLRWPQGFVCPRYWHEPHPPDVPLMPVPRHSDIWNHL